VDPSRFPLATARFERDAPRELVYVGRITPEKGVHVLIDAFRLLRREFPELRLRLVGPDEINPPELVVHISDDPRLHAMLPLFDSRRYRALLAEKLQGLEGAVTFTGNIAHGPRLAEQFGAADVCVFPSIWDEPFGIPVIEAMCTGAPVVITRGGAYPELVEDGTSGLLVDPDDAGALAAALRALLGNAALRRAVGHAAHARACSMFSWDLLASRLSGYYDEARARRAASASPAAD
jgi:glycosyltransferase involved in cell wall biosynthesis